MARYVYNSTTQQLQFASPCVIRGGTLTLTLDSNFAGETITCTKEQAVLEKTVPTTSPYTVIFNIPESGIWTVSSTVGGTTHTTTVNINIDYTAEFGFNWRTWVNTAKYLDSTDYSTLSDLLADEEAVRELCTEHACVDYLCQSVDISTDLETIIKNDIFAKWVNLRDYSLDKMLANAVIKAVMDVSHVEFIGQVPTMTSDTAPYGTAYTNAVYASKSAYIAFDGNDSTYAAFTNAVNNYLQYSFVSLTRIKRVRVKIDGNNNNFKIQVSNDGFSSDIRDIATLENVSDYSDLIIDVESDYGEVSSARIIQTAKNGTSTGIAIYTLQFYAEEYSSKYCYGEWALMPQVPTMTSNTTPYNTVSASGTGISGHDLYMAFDGNASTYTRIDNPGQTPYLQYTFVKPVIVKRCTFSLGNSADYNVEATYTLQGSNDGFVSDINDLGNVTVFQGNSIIDSTNNTTYSAYRLKASNPNWKTSTSSTTATSFLVVEIQFYAWGPKGNVPIMTSNTAPYGEASTNAAYGASGYEVYRAFDNNTSDYWQSSNSGTSNLGRLVYKFTNPVCVKKVLHRMATAAASTYKVQYSDDGTNFTDIADSTYSISQNVNTEIELSNDEYHIYWAIYHVSSVSTTRASASILQFYGRELSDLVPPMISDTVPSGQCVANTTVSQKYYAFDKSSSTAYKSTQSDTNNNFYIGYKFDKPTVINGVSILANSYSASYYYDHAVYGGNDLSSLTKLSSNLRNQAVSSSSVAKSDIFDNSDAYTYYVIKIEASNASNPNNANCDDSIIEISLFGKDYSEKEFEEGTNKKWLYDHGVELETFTYGGNSSYKVLAENDGESIHLKTSNGASGVFGAYAKVSNFDFEPYDLLRLKTGSILSTTSSNNNGRFVQIAIFTVGTTTQIANLPIYKSNSLLPYNYSLDISSVDSSYDIQVFDANNAAAESTVTELWLE